MTPVLPRRRFLLGGTALALCAALGLAARRGAADEETEVFEVSRSEAEWRALLTREQFDVLRLHHTEYPGTSPLLNEHRAGVFACAGCDAPLFDTAAKFDSGTGWPSFYAPLDGRIGTRSDHELLVPRVEVHCARCGGHLGHVFEDGPPPTGLRYCINGAALVFHPA
jgi:peptide-methionine (R)-S-oxide reductase